MITMNPESLKGFHLWSCSGEVGFIVRKLIALEMDEKPEV